MPTLTTSDRCSFCRIVRGDDPAARVIYEDERVVAFFPTKPAVVGHVLVVPRRHVPDIWALDESEAAYLGRVCVRLAGVVRKALRPEGLNVIQSNGAAATQTVFHLHVHLVPRRAGDAMGRIWPARTRYSEAEKDEAWALLRTACQSGVAVGDGPSGEDRRKHLELVQAVVTRMAGASANVKTWLLPVVTALYGFGVTERSAGLALLGLATVLLLMYIDANYLRVEREYRELYDAVARNAAPVRAFSLDPSGVVVPARPGSRRGRLSAVRRAWLPGWSVWRSWSILPFYGVLALIGVVIAISGVWWA
ncbi:HIT family protein [Promicromonospora sp. NPDC060204]|uniref:HIT family protein n=1 Tax=Promicromonospora sp. NPDC060204 TaxID=3347071 RepID=UPI00364C70EF